MDSYESIFRFGAYPNIMNIMSEFIKFQNNE